MFNPYYEITNKQKTKYKILELVVHISLVGQQINNSLVATDLWNKRENESSLQCIILITLLEVDN